MYEPRIFVQYFSAIHFRVDGSKKSRESRKMSRILPRSDHLTSGAVTSRGQAPQGAEKLNTVPRGRNLFSE